MTHPAPAWATTAATHAAPDDGAATFFDVLKNLSEIDAGL